MGIPAVLAVTMVTAVGCCLAVVGATGALLGTWQLLGWIFTGGAPVVAEVWRHSGLTGELFVAFFAWLPLVLGLGILFHLSVAVLGAGLVARRAWARRGALLLAAFWMAMATALWILVCIALEDLASNDLARASFARESQLLATIVALMSIALGVVLVFLLVQPAVRVQFRSGR